MLGGSRADGTHRPDSDWDLGLYYRASEQRFKPASVGELGHPGHVSRLAEWEGRASVSLMFARTRARATRPAAPGCSSMRRSAPRTRVSARGASGRATRSARSSAPASTAAQPLLAHAGATADELAETVHAVAGALGIEPMSAR